MTDILTPTPDWHWQYDASNDRLCLSLSGDWLFQTAYGSKQLKSVTQHNAFFSTQECQYYTDVVELLTALTSFSAAQILQVALNAVVYHSFGKELAPRTWLFDRHIPRTDNACLAALVVNGVIANILILNQSDGFSVCMLLEEITTKTGKKLVPFTTVKVANDILNTSTLAPAPQILSQLA